MLNSSACFGFSEVVRIAGSLQNLSHRAHQAPHVQLVPIMTTCICGGWYAACWTERSYYYLLYVRYHVLGIVEAHEGYTKKHGTPPFVLSPRHGRAYTKAKYTILKTNAIFVNSSRNLTVLVRFSFWAWEGGSMVHLMPTEGP